MSNYRRAWASGGCRFFTVNLLDRRSTILTERIDELREAVRWTLQRYPFRADAFVVLPDHLHAVWNLPRDDTDFAIRWRMIKSHFARSIPHKEHVSRSRRERGERGIWQRRFWEHLIRDEQDYSRHVEYCYINPVKHALVKRVQDWPYSSFHRDVRAGIFPLDWAGEIDIVGQFGERGSPRSSDP
jgi:putative transposase